jgi:hypothetical protein
MSELASGRITDRVDGSSASVATLRWAADLARLRDAEIVAVRAWHVAPGSLAPPTPRCAGRRHGTANAAARRLIWRGDARRIRAAPDVKVGQRWSAARRPRSSSISAWTPACWCWAGITPIPQLRQTVGAITAACPRYAPCPVVIVTAPVCNLDLDSSSPQDIAVPGKPPRGREYVCRRISMHAINSLTSARRASHSRGRANAELRGQLGFSIGERLHSGRDPRGGVVSLDTAAPGPE